MTESLGTSPTNYPRSLRETVVCPEAPSLPLRDFLRLYLTAAIGAAAGLWVVALQIPLSGTGTPYRLASIRAEEPTSARAAQSPPRTSGRRTVESTEQLGAGLTSEKDPSLEDSSRRSLFALTRGGDPSRVRGPVGASLQGCAANRQACSESAGVQQIRGFFRQAFGDGAAWSRKTKDSGWIRGHAGELTGGNAALLPPSPTAAGIKARHHLQALAHSAAHVCGVDRALLWSLFLRESSGRHWDASGKVLRSSSNAWGLGQIKLGTARDVDPALDIMTPWGNAVASACHFRRLLDANRGDERKALHDYHAGQYRRRTSAATLAYATDILSMGGAQ